MSLTRSAALIRHELRVIRADAASLISLTLMPVIMIAFLKPLARLALADEHQGANGSEHSVPAMATMFAFFLVGYIGFAFFSERQNNTWERLRASPATNAEILIGKIVPALLLALFQQTVLFGVGIAVFGLRPQGSIVALFAVVLVLCICLTALGVFVATIFKTNQQLNAVTNLGTMILAGISGAFVPIEVLPTWARTIAPISPQYWALRGYRAVILDGGGLADVALPIAVLLALAAACAVAALARFRFDEPSVRRVDVSVSA